MGKDRKWLKHGISNDGKPPAARYLDTNYSITSRDNTDIRDVYIEAILIGKERKKKMHSHCVKIQAELLESLARKKKTRKYRPKISKLRLKILSCIKCQIWTF